MLLIGSRALAIRDSTFTLGDDKDWDIICSEGNKHLFNNLIRFEWHDPQHLDNEHYQKHSKSTTYITLPNKQEVRVATLEDLSILKRSHLWRDYQWDKHITHYHRHLATHFPVSTQGKNRCKLRFELTKKAYPQGSPSLNKENKDFFDDVVYKVYDHDYLHEVVAFYDKPLYTKLKRDESKAWCEVDLWQQLSYEDQVKCVAEECYVIATERFLIRNGWKYPYKRAYYNAVKKVCTTLTSGWFRDFAIDNFPEVFKTFESERFVYIKEKLQ